MSTTLTMPTHSTASDPPKRWTTAEFDRMIAPGLLEEGAATYLWEGQVVEPMPESIAHINAVANLSALVRERIPSAHWTINQDSPVELEDGTKPQPDLVVFKGPRSGYRVHSPRAENVALLIEVSFSSYPRDAGERLRKYAGMMVPFYWIVNIPARRVEVYELPCEPDDGPAFFEKRTDYGLETRVPLDVTHEGARATAEIAVIDILRDSLEPAEGEAQT